MFVDYGIMAATFVNLRTGRAYLILSTEESRDLAVLYAPEETDKVRRQLIAYRRMPDSVLFRVQEVEVELREVDLPGPTRAKAVCSACAQVVRDGREVRLNGRVLCRPCTGDAYFRRPREISWPEMNWTPGPGLPPSPENLNPPRLTSAPEDDHDQEDSPV